MSNFNEMDEEEFEGEILEYFEDSYQEYWRSQIKRAEWDKAEELFELLEKNKLKALYGENSKLYLFADGESLLAFCLFAQKKEVGLFRKKPALDYIFTFPSHRKKGYASLLINHASEAMRNDGYDKVFISTELKDFAEKCGFNLEKTKNQKNGKVLNIYKRTL